MGEQLAEAVSVGFKNAFWAVYEDTKSNVSVSIDTFLTTYGDQGLLLASMFGLLFWGAGSKTGGQVVWWSLVVFTLFHIFGPKFYLVVIGMLAAKIIFRR